MAGLVPAVHGFFPRIIQDVDARDKRGHDEVKLFLRLEGPRQKTLDRGVYGELLAQDCRDGH